MLTEEEKIQATLSNEFVFEVSVDKLTIAGDNAGNFDSVVSENEFGFIQRSSLAPHPYKRQFYCVDGSFLQWTDLDKFKAIRYEFNPNKVKNSKEREHRRSITQILKTMKYPKINRVDIAIDIYGVDLSQYTLFDGAMRKKNYWVDGLNRLETTYVGAPGSEMRIRMYDKRKESKEPLPYLWWRIEAQLRDSWCLPLFGVALTDNGPFSITPCIPNPFEDLRLFIPSYKLLEDVKERAMIKLLIDDPSEFSNLSKPTRSKYRKILASMPTDKEILITNLFKDYQERILQDILYWLRHPLANDVLEKASQRKSDIRTKEEMEEDLRYMNPLVSSDGTDKEFAVESAKMHMMYNN